MLSEIGADVLIYKPSKHLLKSNLALIFKCFEGDVAISLTDISLKHSVCLHKILKEIDVTMSHYSRSVEYTEQAISYIDLLADGIIFPV